MPAPRRDYRLDEILTRAAWIASRGAPGDPAPASEEEIRTRARCQPGPAFRAWVIQRAASRALVTLWLDEDLTMVQTLRIALADPFAEGAQIAAACSASPLVRAVVASRSE